MPDDKHRDLIHKQLTGSISAEEEKNLSEWIARSKSNSAYYKACRAFYEAGHQQLREPDINKHWLTLKERIDNFETAKTSRTVTAFSHVSWKVAAAFIVVALGTLLIGRSYFSEQQTRVANSTTAPLMHYLPDGSVVWLNVGSAISYSRELDQSQRKLTLSGEAFFEVKLNPKKPFVVRAADTEVKVLGTSFNVRTEDSGTVELSVMTGKVSFGHINEKSRAVLLAGDAAKYDRVIKQILPIVKEDPNVLAWKTGVLSFEKAALAEVVKVLNAHYKTNIAFDDDISSCKFTGSIRKLSLEEALEIVRLSLSLKTQTIDGRVLLTGHGCK